MDYSIVRFDVSIYYSVLTGLFFVIFLRVTNVITIIIIIIDWLCLFNICSRS